MVRNPLPLNYYNGNDNKKQAYFVNARADADYRPDETVIQHVNEFLKLMAVLTGDNRYEEIGAELSEEDRKAGISMCKVLDYREARGEARGKLLMLSDFIASGIITMETAAKKMDMSVEEFSVALAGLKAGLNSR